ncbi:hypothetical protein BKN38_07365 [Helicobacter sp. CLO-3]|uniref:tRNA pseudouridine(55) synthase TruB n=1 Tax=unclassified Helicobacter TaxID=2593540 RepID=UPI000804F84E|nr:MULTISPECIES: tRNA pseudouridine(55) synthase TruB [unclassified Helicobacter]OBV29387.1 hypothetical protein BA723_05530 [Helicobacter sp. CLO-3]OHU82347.1 hypothetical protein BKN38_07365 [Helicobacter sp. CLO-3]
MNTKNANSAISALDVTLGAPDALIIAHKPPFVTSNAFVARLKRRFGAKSAGFSGILDPFARGCLVVAFGAHTRLLPHLALDRKVYEATLWLGAESRSLDIENMTRIDSAPRFDEAQIRAICEDLVGEISYTPPIFSAKKIAGKRAYELARAGEEVSLPAQMMRIFRLEFLGYNHPFVSFRAEVSKGAYIRSIGEIIASKLGVKGALCSLCRVSEGGFGIESGNKAESSEMVAKVDSDKNAPKNTTQKDASQKIVPNAPEILETQKTQKNLARKIPMGAVMLLDSFEILPYEEICLQDIIQNAIIMPNATSAPESAPIEQNTPATQTMQTTPNPQNPENPQTARATQTTQNPQITQTTTHAQTAQIKQKLYNGTKFSIKNHKSGIYKVKFDDFFSIIRICDDGNISYIINRISYAHSLPQAR